MASHATSGDTSNMASERPVTSKSRGICKYYATPRGCFAGNRCKFLHGEQERLTPFDQSKPCRFYAAGYCKRGAQCWFLHAQPPSGSSMAPAEPPAEDESDCACSICYDTPVTYGLLAGCSHVFCIKCIKGWRDKRDKTQDVIISGAIKTCPMCRSPSKFITPSSVFYPQDHPGKTAIIEQYKASMARVPCKFFKKSLAEDRFCPFGNDCFYQHLNADGTTHEFEKGADYYIKQRRRYHYANVEASERAGTSVLASLQVALNRFRASLEGIPGIAHLPDDAFAAEAVMASEMSVMRLDELHPAVSPSAVTALAETLWSSLVQVLDNPESATPHSRGVVIVDEEHQTIGQSSFAPTLDNGRWPVPLRWRSPDLWDMPQRLPDDLDGSPQTESDPRTPLEEDLVLNYGSDDAVTASDNSEEDGFAEDVPSAAEDVAASELDTTPIPQQISSCDTATAVSGASLEHATADVPMVVHDNDPPFMTDGRGRVVWSSTTATRGRRSRTSTSISSTAPVLPLHRDNKPCDGPSSELRS